MFTQLSCFEATKPLVDGLIGVGNRMGEGWFLPAEMIELVNHGYENIVCTQPFGCLPNHVVGKGVIKTIREKYPDANISPVDYDPGASEANQANRIKLLMTVAKDNLEKKQAMFSGTGPKNITQEEKEDKAKALV